MRISNIHQRVVTADATDIAPLLATLGQPGDMLYPPLWKPMWFDGPVAVGARGTHGTITAYEPGRLMEIAIPPGMGITGVHTFTVTPLGPHRSLVRHEIAAKATPLGWLGWQVAVRAAHDAVLEGLLDRLQAAVGTPPAHRATPSAYARLLRWVGRPHAQAVPVLETELLTGVFSRVDFSDAFAIDTRGVRLDARGWTQAIFGSAPPWVVALMGVRQLLVGLIGIERHTPGALRDLAGDDDEVMLGADAGHLDFRASLRRDPGRITLTTVVRLRNRRGRAYFAVVRRLHPYVVRAMLYRAVARASDMHRPLRAAATIG